MDIGMLYFIALVVIYLSRYVMDIIESITRHLTQSYITKHIQLPRCALKQAFPQ